MPILPSFNPKTKKNKSPHIVILGAGASLQSFPNGDKYGKKFPLMNDFLETVGLTELLKSYNINTQKINFEDFYDDLVSKKRDTELQKTIENKVYDYFAGMIIPDEVTIYDYLVLSLREKDLIASFNWDPMLVQAYRRNTKLRRLPHICFLHGNVGVGACIEDRRYGYIDQKCSRCGKPFQRGRLLYPIKNKDYTSDIFIENEWNNLKHFLEYGYFMTIFGYSAPKTDIAARDIMTEIWKKNETRELAEIEIIDLKSKEVLLETWHEFIVSWHYSTMDSFKKSYLWRHPRRTCDAWAGATLQSEPWYDNPFEETQNLNELQSCISLLINEEIDVEEKGIPFKIK